MRDPIRKYKYEKVEQQFLEAYERIKKKKEDVEAKTENITQKFGYYTQMSNIYYRRLWARLRRRAAHIKIQK